MGINPCIGENIVTTPLGKGHTYLVETISANPDTVMLYSVPPGFVNIPSEWRELVSGFLLPDDGQRKLKMRISYQIPFEEIPIICAANIYYPPLLHNRTQYIFVKAEMKE